MTELTNADRIVLLAASIEDYLPGPWMGRHEWAAEGPSEKRQCRACDGEGRRRTRNGLEPCQACGSKGSVLVDAYTGRVVAKVNGPLFELRDGEISETLAAERSDFDARQRRRRRVEHLLVDQREGEDWVDYVLRCKRALYRDGDYALLQRRAAELPGPLQAAFWLVYGPRAQERQTGPRLQALAGEALERLDAAMPHCRVPVWLVGPKSRDDEIVALNERGMKQAEIAQRVGVSTWTVSTTLKRRMAS
jgi:hypothetical protein